MARPERPVEGSGPVPELARELRKIRDRAGTLGYREMAAAANYSAETLSSAARGTGCPSWGVVKAFADACDPTGAAACRVRPLWERASRRKAAPGRRRLQAAVAARPARAGTSPPAGRPAPDRADTAAQYVYQLRALRAWAGNPTPWETRSRLGTWWDLPPSTMYDALSFKRTTLPNLRTVKLIVMSCLDDDAAVEEWVSAWRDISLREFTRANPKPAADPADAGRAPLRAVAS